MQLWGRVGPGTGLKDPAEALWRPELLHAWRGEPTTADHCIPGVQARTQ